MTAQKYGDVRVMTDLLGFFSRDQIKSIIKYAPTAEERMLYKLLMHGRRITEVLGRKEFVHKYRDKHTGELKEKHYPAVEGLKPSHLNIEYEQIKFRLLKKGRETYDLFPIEHKIFQELLQYIRENNIQDDENIFKLNRFQVNYRLKKLCKGLGIHLIGSKKPHAHHFRHSFAVHLLKNSNDPTDIKKVQMALGHSDINVTSGYLKLGKEDLRKTINKTFGDTDD